MNIFCISRDPTQAARWLCDKHLPKMATETGQMLACAAIRHGVPTAKLPLTKAGTPVKGGYHFHPCSKWSGDSRANYLWLVKHGLAICEEYTARFNRTHFCEKGIRQLGELADYIPAGNQTEFAIAINSEQSCQKVAGFETLSVVDKYRLYYKMDKPFAKWRQNKPDWMK